MKILYSNEQAFKEVEKFLEENEYFFQAEKYGNFWMITINF